MIQGFKASRLQGVIHDDSRHDFFKMILGSAIEIWGAQQLRTGCLLILMFLAPLAEVTP